MGTGTRAAGGREVRGHLLRTALVAVLLLVTLFAPAAGVSVAVTSGGGVSSGCTAPEAHEELRPGRPDRERPRPALPRAERPAVELTAPGAGFGSHRPAADLTRTRIEAQPHPLERIPIQRN